MKRPLYLYPPLHCFNISRIIQPWALHHCHQAVRGPGELLVFRGAPPGCLCCWWIWQARLSVDIYGLYLYNKHLCRKSFVHSTNYKWILKQCSTDTLPEWSGILMMVVLAFKLIASLGWRLILKLEDSYWCIWKSSKETNGKSYVFYQTYVFLCVLGEGEGGLRRDQFIFRFNLT